MNASKNTKGDKNFMNFLKEYLNHQKVFTDDEINRYYNIFLVINNNHNLPHIFKLSEVFPKWIDFPPRQRRALGRFFSYSVKIGLLNSIIQIPRKSMTNFYKKIN